jgi:amino acid transporter
MVMDYVLNPLICTAICAKLIMNVPFVPSLPFPAWAVFFATVFTVLNLRGVKTSARIDEWLCAGMTVVVLVFLGVVVRYVWGLDERGAGFFIQPFYDKATFSTGSLFRGTSVAVLTYIGFDAVSTLSRSREPSATSCSRPCSCAWLPARFPPPKPMAPSSCGARRPSRVGRWNPRFRSSPGRPAASSCSM